MNHDLTITDPEWDVPAVEDIAPEPVAAPANAPAVANAPSQPATAGNSDGMPTDLATAIRMWQDLGNVTDLHRRSRSQQRAHFELRRRVGRRCFELQQAAQAPVTDARVLAEATANTRRVQTDIARRFLNASK